MHWILCFYLHSTAIFPEILRRETTTSYIFELVFPDHGLYLEEFTVKQSMNSNHIVYCKTKKMKRSKRWRIPNQTIETLPEKQRICHSRHQKESVKANTVRSASNGDLCGASGHSHSNMTLIWFVFRSWLNDVLISNHWLVWRVGSSRRYSWVSS
eukprot:150903_1